MIGLDSKIFVSGQIAPSDIAEAAAAGVKTIVNNRPDGEEPGQPTSAEIEAASRAAGLAYRHIPVAGGFSQSQVEAMAKALEDGPVLAFCRSGTRSTWLWALARARLGAPAAELVAMAAAAGYDLAPIRLYLGGRSAPPVS
ncbi:MAG TPA: TIGR01244 family sulfur transferase [Allosphingosinicella sp.]|nr:TIGR01244 family sulfur transferase [Allosphingosinicella sp.]